MHDPPPSIAKPAWPVTSPMSSPFASKPSTWNRWLPPATIVAAAGVSLMLASGPPWPRPCRPAMNAGDTTWALAGIELITLSQSL